MAGKSGSISTGGFGKIQKYIILYVRQYLKGEVEEFVARQRTSK